MQVLGELQESSPSLPQQILAEIHFQIGPGRFEETMPTVSQLQLPRRRQAQPATALHQYSPACTRGGTASDPSPPALPQVAANRKMTRLWGEGAGRATKTDNKDETYDNDNQNSETEFGR